MVRREIKRAHKANYDEKGKKKNNNKVDAQQNYTGIVELK